MKIVMTNQIKYAALLGIAFVLTACGGGGGSSPQNTQISGTTVPTGTPSGTGSSTGGASAAKTFTLLNASGGTDVSLGASCARDETTGLVWERKTDEAQGALPDFRDKDYAYNWSDNLTAGVQAGTAQTANLLTSTFPCQQANGMTHCNTAAYVNAVNRQRLCGFNDWRLPTTQELLGLFDARRTSAPYIYPELGSTAADPEPVAGNPVRGYWSSTPASAGWHQAVSYSRLDGNRAQGHSDTGSRNYVRLVRGTAR